MIQEGFERSFSPYIGVGLEIAFFFEDEMLERRMVAGAVAYSAVFLGDQGQSEEYYGATRTCQQKY